MNLLNIIGLYTKQQVRDAFQEGQIKGQSEAFESLDSNDGKPKPKDLKKLKGGGNFYTKGGGGGTVSQELINYAQACEQIMKPKRTYTKRKVK